ncbi:MAG TPA: hypothetical protein VMZ26_15900 [Pyrinomonadaceae bacterium]|nr:hypothetical protein [Pyrinomonadaceae bacterium]
MANQIGNNAAAEARNESDIQNSNPPFFSNKPRSATEKNDELIVSLSDAYENRRARQVGEWERLYGQNVYRAN